MWLFNKRIVFYLIIVKCIFLFIIYILHSFSLSVNKRTKQQYKGNYNSKNKQSVYYLFHTITLLCQIGIWHSVKLKFSLHLIPNQSSLYLRQPRSDTFRYRGQCLQSVRFHRKWKPCFQHP